MASYKQTIRGFVRGGSDAELVQSLGLQDALNVEVDLTPATAPSTPEVDSTYVPPLAAAADPSNEGRVQFLPTLPPPYDPRTGAAPETTARYGDGVDDTGGGLAQDGVRREAAQ